MKNFPLDLNKVKEHFYIDPKISLTEHHERRFEYEWGKNVSFDTDWRDVVNLLYNLRLKYVESRFPAQLRISFEHATNYYLHSLDFNISGRKNPITNNYYLEKSLILDSDDEYLQLRGVGYLDIDLRGKSCLVQNPDLQVLLVPI